MLASKNFKILTKEINLEDKIWFIKASHDAYLKSNGVIHERQINYFTDRLSIIGDRISLMGVIGEIATSNAFVMNILRYHFDLMPI